MFKWEILEVLSANNTLENIKYKVSLIEGEHVVETEGNCPLILPENVVFKDLIEVELIEYMKRFYIQDDVNTIESNLTKQMANLTKVQTNLPPWHIETFKLEV